MGTLVYLSLGSNLGEREMYINEALQRISTRAGNITTISRFYESEPWGFESDASFLNICAALETNSSPFELLNIFQSIEKEIGRVKNLGEGYTSRIIDIDIVSFGSQIVDTEPLQIPHPQMEKRKFVLLPLAEIAPDFTHPKTTKSIQQILAACNDETTVSIYENK
jgi:2-amino-4-hydroxy-6-hydroxymethyldihydropteridine diphosphokinase